MTPETTTAGSAGPPRSETGSWAQRYRRVRAMSERLAAPLSAEDCCAQSMPEASPTKWHLAHASWFFEDFVLRPNAAGYEPFDRAFTYLFNSYYNTIGDRQPRPQRGLLTRPSLECVYEYRRHVDEAMQRLFDEADETAWARIGPVVEIGLHHEQQHQELILTDIKHLLACNRALKPAYRGQPHRPAEPGGMRWVEFAEGVRRIGRDEGDGFSYDNERPRHRVFLEPFALADRLVTCGQYIEFIEDGGYDRHELWLDAGWAVAQRRGWRAPQYWHRDGGEWVVFTLDGSRPVDLNEPVCHVSFYEADAYARWAGARLPSEQQWEAACAERPVRGNLLRGDETDRLHPDGGAEPSDGHTIRQAFGDVWEWTRSDYGPYPGYAPPAGAIGEYNGKFMSDQYVLRGGSCFTPADHIRATYRNFFPADARWQMSGIRLAKDLV